MKVYCTPRFIREIQHLSKNKSYIGVLEDLCNHFKDKTIDEVHIILPLQRIPGKFSVNKHRIQNEGRGKSSSYRCILICYPEKDRVYLGTIYPKTGSEGKGNLKKEEYKAIAGEIMKAVASNDLYLLDLENQEYK